MTPTQIRSLRESFGMSQEEFALLLGLGHRASVSRLESGTRPATGAVLAFLRHLAECRRSEKNSQIPSESC